MADLNALKQKYAPVLDTINSFSEYGAKLDSVDLDGEKLHLKGEVPSTVIAILVMTGWPLSSVFGT